MLKFFNKNILFLLVLNVSFSQNEANIWYFGEHAGLDFNSGEPIPLTDGALNTNEGCATISDQNGDLLFYTDGITVYNKNHNVMLNGAGLNGDESSTHSAIIVPKPGDVNVYYIFTVDDLAGPNGLQYSEVDMTLDGDLGGITNNKNVLLHTPTTEKITAIKSSNSEAYWVISHKWESNEFIAYNISSLGINTTPVISATGTFIGGSNMDKTLGQVKISPDGTKLAVARAQGLSEAQLFDFDSNTGVVSNPLTLIDFSPDVEQVYGIEFSPNSNIVYVGVTGDAVYQFNLEAGSSADIINSKVQLTTLPRPYGALQLATDGRIYIAKKNRMYIDVIDNPNVVGAGCEYQFEHLYLGGQKSELGLPPFIQTFFIVGFQFENVCFGDTTQFNANISHTYDNLVWDFGDGATSTDENPAHSFIAPGTYTVTLSVTTGSDTTSNSKDITIYENPLAYPVANQVACDDDGDGYVYYDLSQHASTVLNGQDADQFVLTFYDSMSNYTNGVPINDPTNFENLTPGSAFPIISISNVDNPECNDYTEIQIDFLEGSLPNQDVPGLSECDNTSFGTDTDGIIVFDLTANETVILNGQNPDNFSIQYFRDADFTDQINNPSTYQNVNSSETIYIKMVNSANSVCFGITEFTIEVLELPTVSSVVDLLQCDDNLDGFSLFNLLQANAEISTNHLNEAITFYETEINAENENNPITNLSDYLNEIVSADKVWARTENENGCFRISEINLIVSTTQIPSTYSKDFYQCDDGDNSSDGIATFDLTSVSDDIEAMFPTGQQLIINYYRNLPDALSESNAILNINSYQNTGYPFTQDVYVRVDSALDNDCLGLGHHITLHVETVPIANTVNIDEQCDNDGDGEHAFDTSNIESDLLNGQTNVTVSYFDSLGNSLPSPLPNPFVSATQTITARLTNALSQDPDGACFDETQISFNVSEAAIAYPVSDYIECDDNDDGMFAFNTSSVETTVLNGQTGMIVSYFDESGNSLPSPLPNPFSSNTQTVTIRVENPLSLNCYDETTVNFIVSESPVLNMEDQWTICEGDNVEIIADSGYDEYMWDTGETTESLIVSAPGQYTITVANIYGSLRCESSKTITVVQSGEAIITNIDTNDWSATNNSISIEVEGSGDYEFSINGVIYQDSNVFTNLPINEYTVHVRDKNGCGTITQDVYLLFYPLYFTPNGDGFNDRWQLKNAIKEPNNIVHIYDRYGKLLKNLSPYENGWDGTFNGHKLPASDYWFVLQRQNGKTYRGHFSLKR